MKAIIVLISLLASATATPWRMHREDHGIGNGNGNGNGNVFRHYDSREERADRMSAFLWEDENGHIRVENLINTTFISRAGDISDITLYLYTKDNPEMEEMIKPNDFLSLIESNYFNPSHKTVFIVHGWHNDHQSKVNVLIRDALLTWDANINIFVVDWSPIAQSNYVSAVFSVPGIGSGLAQFLDKLLNHYNVSSKNITLIGHSLGAHICGIAGSKLRDKVDYIIGLDPASPLFSLGNTDTRVDESDADFVQIVHSNGGLLGFASSIGHTDYFPNGGKNQPGCGFDLTGQCAHSRSYQYFAESLRRNARFIAHNCESYTQYEEGNCYDNHESFLGNYYIDKEAYGDYYLQTNDKEPFAQS